MAQWDQIPLTLRRPWLDVVVVGPAQTWVPVGRRVVVVAMVSSVGKAGYVGVVQVDVGGFGRLAVGVVVSVVMVVVVMVVVAVGVGHGVGAGQAPHRLLHVGVVRGRLHLQGALSGVGLVPVGSAVTSVHEVVSEESAVALRRNAQSETAAARSLPLHF